MELIDRVLFSRWKAGPTDDDVARLDAAMATYEKRLGKKLFYVGSVTSEAKVPSAAERVNLQKLMTRSRSFCDHAFLIMEGDELQSNLIRAILSGILIVTRTYGDYLTIHKNAKQVEDELRKRFNYDGSSVMEKARDRKVVL
jgi:hypothetical protein